MKPMKLRTPLFAAVAAFLMFFSVSAAAHDVKIVSPYVDDDELPSGIYNPYGTPKGCGKRGRNPPMCQALKRGKVIEMLDFLTETYTGTNQGFDPAIGKVLDGFATIVKANKTDFLFTRKVHHHLRKVVERCIPLNIASDDCKPDAHTLHLLQHAWEIFAQMIKPNSLPVGSVYKHPQSHTPPSKRFSYGGSTNTQAAHANAIAEDFFGVLPY